MGCDRKTGFLDEPEPGFNLALAGVLVLTCTGFFVWECVQWIRTGPEHPDGRSVRLIIEAGVGVAMSTLLFVRCRKGRVSKEPCSKEPGSSETKPPSSAP